MFILFFETRYTKQRSTLRYNSNNIPPSPPLLLELTRDSNIFDAMEKPNGKVITPNISLIRIRRESPTPVITIPIEEFSTEQGYYPRTITFYFSHGNVTIVTNNNKYFIYRKNATTVKLVDVTSFVYIQAEFIQLVFFWDICFIIFVYLISLYFVKSSLKHLKKLTRFAKNLDFENLSTAIHLKGHKHDEIKVIAEALNTSLEKINTQILSLKDFISNASHELKTPLMMINSEIDIALKEQHYQDHLLNIKQHIKRISDLLDTLSLITRLEGEKQRKPKNTTV
jgi:signal transduction histidine kinase